MSLGPHWPWYLGGITLASITLGHFVFLGRTLAVSGRITALVDRVLHGDEDPEQPMSREESIAAMRAATAEAFGPEALDAAPLPEATAKEPTNDVLAPARPLAHVAFFIGLVVGGLAATLATGTFAPTPGLASEVLPVVFGSVPIPLVLLVGGVLVGFGTRMGGGCTSGHGLSGLGRLQPGSILATASFFSAAILTSLLLEALS